MVMIVPSPRVCYTLTGAVVLLVLLLFPFHHKAVLRQKLPSYNEDNNSTSSLTKTFSMFPSTHSLLHPFSGHRSRPARPRPKDDPEKPIKPSKSKSDPAKPKSDPEKIESDPEEATSDPAETNPVDPNSPTWLIATLCPAKASRRRNIIRTTWQAKYTANNSQITTRFVLSNYDGVWDPLIQAENDTYGDIVALKDLDPSPDTSNRIKATEFFKYIFAEAGEDVSALANESSTHLSKEPTSAPLNSPYSFVTKLDDDSFLSAVEFYDHYLNRTDLPSQELLYSRRSRTASHESFDWPGGAFYTLSWPLLRKLVVQATTHPVLDHPEDVLVGKYLYDASTEYDFVHLPEQVMHDLDIPSGYVPRRITNQTELVHMIKEDELYLEIGGIFTEEHGYNGGHLKDLTLEKGMENPPKVAKQLDGLPLLDNVREVPPTAEELQAVETAKKQAEEEEKQKQELAKQEEEQQLKQQELKDQEEKEAKQGKKKQQKTGQTQKQPSEKGGGSEKADDAQAGDAGAGAGAGPAGAP